MDCRKGCILGSTGEPYLNPKVLPSALNLIHSTAYSQLLLRRWQYADLRRGHDHAHGIHAQKSLLWRCCQ